MPPTPAGEASHSPSQHTATQPHSHTATEGLLCARPSAMEARATATVLGGTASPGVDECSRVGLYEQLPPREQTKNIFQNEGVSILNGERRNESNFLSLFFPPL